MPIVTIEGEDGQTNEVEVPTDAVEYQEAELDDVDNDELPDGVVTQDSIDAALNNRLPRAYRKTLESVGLDPSAFKDEDDNYDLSDLDENKAFQRLAEKQGIELREDGRPKGSLSDEEIQDLQERAQKYEDVRDELDDLRQQTRQRKLDEAWEELKEHTPAFREGAEEVLRKDFESRVELDDEHGVVLLDEDGNIRKDEVHSPVGVQALAEELPEERAFAFESTEMEGGPDDKPGTTSPSGDTLSREQYEQELEKATDAGNHERVKELREKAANDEILD